jgi:hypothetical protein
MIKKLLNATKINQYSPDGTFNLMYLSGMCISNSDNSTLRSRPHSGGFAEENLKAFLSYVPFTLRTSFAMFRVNPSFAKNETDI